MSVVLAGSSACNGPTKPTVVIPPTEAPQLFCPAPLTTPSIDGHPTVVTYADPLVTGGSLPRTLSCTPVSGSSFQPGLTTVTCNVVDAQQRSASCTFGVTVVVPPRIVFTKFLAFGDSMTAGEVTNPVSVMKLQLLPAKSYPADLAASLASRYTAQGIRVDNAGLSGEHIADAVGRLSACLAGQTVRIGLGDQAFACSPPPFYEALLLLGGANDLHDDGGAAIPDVIAGLQKMERAARSAGLRPFLATLPPQREIGIRGEGAPFVAALNGQIRALAANEGISLVDVFDGFPADTIGLIGEDGLHPTEAGYALIADTFFRTLSQALEAPPTLTLSPFGVGGLVPRRR